MAWRIIFLLTIGTTLVPVASFAQPALSELQQKIVVPPGHKLLFKLKAKGVQIYKAAEGESGALGWVLEAPLANLFDGNGQNAGHHYDSPPAWESTDGSKVIKSDAKSAPAPKPTDIPWLLVKVQSEKGTVGTFSPVDYIQRLDTEGGKAPAALPKRVGTKIGMAYQATYYFYGHVE